MRVSASVDPERERVRQTIKEGIAWSLVEPPPQLEGSLSPYFHLPNCFVLTGSNGAGKSSAIELLRKQGLAAQAENLREFSDAVRQSVSDADILRHMDLIVETGAATHLRVLIPSLQRWSSDPIFFDRGIGDYIGLLKMMKLMIEPWMPREFVAQFVRDPAYREALNTPGKFIEMREEIDQQINYLRGWGRIIRYGKVLWLNDLPKFEDDYLRPQDGGLRHLTSLVIRQSWMELGYLPVRVPHFWGKMDERVQFILNKAFR